MNIFILDLNQRLNARYYCDKHVVKQITEFNQLLSSVYYFTSYIPATAYKLYGKNHPCAKWTRESLANWLWLRDMTFELCKEYTYRYGKIHKGESVCKVDMTDFNNRKEKKIRMKELKNKMDAQVKKLQESAVYEMLADKDDELKSMLQEYKLLKNSNANDIVF
jgi:hypothetical protein